MTTLYALSLKEAKNKVLVHAKNKVLVHGAFNDLCVAYFMNTKQLLQAWNNMQFDSNNSKLLTTARLKTINGELTIFPAFGFWFNGEIVRDTLYLQDVLAKKASWPYDPNWADSHIENGAVVKYVDTDTYEYECDLVRKALFPKNHTKVGHVLSTMYSPVWPKATSGKSLSQALKEVLSEDEPLLEPLEDLYDPDADDDEEENS